LEDVGVERTPVHTGWARHHGQGTIFRAPTVVVEAKYVWEVGIFQGFFAFTHTISVVAGMSFRRTARVRWLEKVLLISHAALLADGAAHLHEKIRGRPWGGEARSPNVGSGHPVTSMAVNG